MERAPSNSPPYSGAQHSPQPSRGGPAAGGVCTAGQGGPSSTSHAFQTPTRRLGSQHAPQPYRAYAGGEPRALSPAGWNRDDAVDPLGSISACHGPLFNPWDAGQYLQLSIQVPPSSLNTCHVPVWVVVPVVCHAFGLVLSRVDLTSESNAPSLSLVRKTKRGPVPAATVHEGDTKASKAKYCRKNGYPIGNRGEYDIRFVWVHRIRPLPSGIRWISDIIYDKAGYMSGIVGYHIHIKWCA